MLSNFTSYVTKKKETAHIWEYKVGNNDTVGHFMKNPNEMNTPSPLDAILTVELVV